MPSTWCVHPSPGTASRGPEGARMGLRRIAGAFVQLMARLGYDRYGAQGGDWGAVISTHIADLDPSHTVGIHLNIVPTLPPEDDPMAGVLPEEAAQLQDFQQFQRQETGYQEIHRTKPQTLGSALNDRRWVCCLDRGEVPPWTDCDGDVERAITFDELLTNITIYWVTETSLPRCASISRPIALAGPVSYANASRCPSDAPSSPRSCSDRLEPGPNERSTSCTGKRCREVATSPRSSSRSCSSRTSGRSSGRCDD